MGAAKKLSESSGPKVSNALKEFFSVVDKISKIANKKEIEEFF